MRRTYYTQHIIVAALLLAIIAFIECSIIDKTDSSTTKEAKNNTLSNFMRSALDGKLTEAQLKEAERKVFELNPGKLKDLWHHAMVKALLRSKAKQVYAKLPFVEQVVYEQCEQGAKSLSHLAKCVVTLLNERDRRRQEEEIQRRKAEAAAEKRRKQEEARMALEREREMLAQRNRFISIRTDLRPLAYRPGYASHKLYSTNSNTEPGQLSLYAHPPIYNIFAPVPASELNIGMAELRANAMRSRSQSRSIARQIRPQLRTMQQNRMNKWRFLYGYPVRHQSNDFGYDYYNARTEYEDETEAMERRDSERTPPWLKASENHNRDNKGTRFARSSDKSIQPFFPSAIVKILANPSRNVAGPDRYMQINQTIKSLEESRQARSVPSMSEAKEKHTRTHRSTPNLGFPALAARYLRNWLGAPSSGPAESSTVPQSSTAKLQMIREHFERVDKCNQYFRLMSEENKSIFKQLGVPIRVRDPHVSASKEEEILKDVVDLLNDFTEATANGRKDNTKWSILSPRFFSMLPNGRRTHSADFILDKGKLLSPTMLSFQSEGFFSIPELFNIVTADQTSQHVLMDLIMEVSGASEALDEAISKLEPEILHTKNVQFPLVQQMSRMDHAWLQIRKSYTAAQNRQISESGYAFLEPEQLRMIYGEEAINLRLNITEYGKMTAAEREARIENDIRNLASYGDERAKDLLKWGRKRRSVDVHPSIKEGVTQKPYIDQQPDPGSRITLGPDDIALQIDTQTQSSVRETTTNIREVNGSTPESTDPNDRSEERQRVNGVLFETLEPFAFANIVNFGGALEVATLSPHAFLAEIIRPEALILSTLSPRAFVATVLSPEALMLRTLSPTAFRAEVLSPRALNAWVLSPEALIAEVLTPHFLEPRILSPESLVIDVLSPRILSPNIMSPESLGVFVLSPNILSPRILSEERYLVEVLSPHILGGPHSKEEEEQSVISIGAPKEHEGEPPGLPNHPAHGPEAAWDLNGGGQPPPPPPPHFHTHEDGDIHFELG